MTPPLPLPDIPEHRLQFVVYGTPAPQGSKRHVGRGIMIESNKEAVQTWREDVKLAALRALEETPGWRRDYPAVTAHLVFTLARPRGHYRSGRFSDQLKPDAPHLHTTKPDLDKLIRSTGDALTAAGVYTDDSRLAKVYAAKGYTAWRSLPPGALDRPGASIILTGVKP